MEQTVDGLRSLPQQEEQIQGWQFVWDEMTDMQLEVQEEDSDGVIQHKQPDAWAVNWEEQNLLIMEFTRLNDRGIIPPQDRYT